MKKLSFFVCLLVCMFLINSNLFAQACPNGDFENWNSKSFGVPDSGWFTSNIQSLKNIDSLTVWQVAGHSGQAIHIETAVVGTDTAMAYIENTQGDPTTGQGGVPYSQQPTAITGYYRYSLAGNDSATIIVIFKKSGAVISSNIIKFRGTGSVSAFTAFSFPLATLATAPDSVIIAAASSNVFGSGLQSGSWLELDQLAFAGSGITQGIAGGSFDSWIAQSYNIPLGCNFQQNGNSFSVLRSTTHYAGSYSIELVTQASNGGGGGSSSNPAQISTGQIGNNGPQGGLPYTLNVDTLTGYYMYMPVGTDTASINIDLTHTGTNVGGNSHNFFAASSWTYFQIPFTASNPDEIRIDVQSGSWSVSRPGTAFYLDYVQLKSQPLPPANVGIVNYVNSISAYPNPANDILNIRLNNMQKEPVTVAICDVAGRIIDKVSYYIAPSVISFPVEHLASGIYLYQVNNSGYITRGKFIKQ